MRRRALQSIYPRPLGAQVQPIPLTDLAAVHFPVLAELHVAFERVLTSGVFVGGAEVEAFEDELADYVGSRFAVGVSSGTAALRLVLEAAGIGPGDEVILPPNTFFATAEAVVAVGARPVLADVDEATGLIDPRAVAAAVGARTAAVIAVHLHGQPADTEALSSIASRHGLLLLEDAAQAIGAAVGGRSVGTLAAAAAFSFYPAKNLGALGDAGAVTTGDPQLAGRIRQLRNHGETRRHQHDHFGHTERLDSLQAAFLRVKLRQLPEAQARRDAAVGTYASLLPSVHHAVPLSQRFGVRHVHHHLVVRVPHRDAVLTALLLRDVEAAVHYPVPLHHQPAWPDRPAPGAFPAAEVLMASILSLPLYAGMSDLQVRRAVDALQESIEQTLLLAEEGKTACVSL